MKRKLSLLLCVTLILSTLAGCGVEITDTAPVVKESEEINKEEKLGENTLEYLTDLRYNSIGKEILASEENQNHLNKVQPPPKLEWSLERENLIKRILRWNDPNKTGYIYLFSDTGTLVGYFMIKGKVSSVNSKLTTSLQPIKDPNFYADVGQGSAASMRSMLMESPDFDGSYGTNGDGIFFFLTDDTYCEWNGKYFVSDRYVKLNQEPIMVYELKDEDVK